MRQRDKLGEYTEEQGTVLDRHAARRYARALRVAIAVKHPLRGGLEHLSRSMGYSRVHVSQVLRARRSPTRQFIARACAVLNCPPAVLDALAAPTATGEPLTDYLLGLWE